MAYTVGSSELNVPFPLAGGELAGPPMYLGFAVTAGTTTLVAATPKKQIVVLSFGLTNSGTAAAINLQSHTLTTQATGARVLAANAGFEKPYCPVGCFAAVVGEALDIVVAAGGIAAGELVFIYAGAV